MREKYIKLRDEKGMTNSQVARESGVPVTTLTSFLKNGTNLSIENAKKIAKLFGVTIDYLAE